MEPYLASHDIYGRSTHFDLGRYVAGQRASVFKNAPAGLLSRTMPASGGLD